MSGTLKEIRVTRPTVNTRLGIRLASETPDDPPVVKAIAGVATESDLEEGDIILKIDGVEARNSVVATVLFGKAGTEVVLVVRRFGGSAPTSTVTTNVTIARNALGLGLVVDATNTITDLVAGSAAAQHKQLHVGQKIVAVAGRQLPPGASLAASIPKGNDPFVLSVVSTGGPGAVAPLPGGSSMASLSAAAATLPPRAPFEHRVAAKKQFTNAQVAELRKAFVLLGGSDEVRIGPTQVLAAAAHFEKDATIQQIYQMCLRHARRDDAQLSFVEFTALMLELSASASAPSALFDALDHPGIGIVSKVCLPAPLVAPPRRLPACVRVRACVRARACACRSLVRSVDRVSPWS